MRKACWLLESQVAHWLLEGRSLVCRRLGGTNPGFFTGKPLKPLHDLALKYKDTILHVLYHQTSAECPGSACSRPGQRARAAGSALAGLGHGFSALREQVASLISDGVCSDSTTLRKQTSKI